MKVFEYDREVLLNTLKQRSEIEVKLIDLYVNHVPYTSELDDFANKLRQDVSMINTELLSTHVVNQYIRFVYDFYNFLEELDNKTTPLIYDYIIGVYGFRDVYSREFEETKETPMNSMNLIYIKEYNEGLLMQNKTKESEELLETLRVNMLLEVEIMLDIYTRKYMLLKLLESGYTLEDVI